MTGTRFSFFTIARTGSNNVCRFSASLIVDLRSFRLQPPRRLGIRLYTLRFINVNSQQTWTSRAFNDTYQGVPAIFFIFLINQLLVNNVYHFVLFSSSGRNVCDLFIKTLITAARNGDVMDTWSHATYFQYTMALLSFADGRHNDLWVSNKKLNNFLLKIQYRLFCTYINT